MYGGQLADAQGEVATCGEAQNGCAVSFRPASAAVDGERLVGEDGKEERLEVVNGCGKGSGRGFRVVESDDEDILAIGKGPVPLIVVADVTDAEAAAVDGEEGRESGRRGLVVGFGEEDPAYVALDRDVAQRYGEKDAPNR